MRYLSEEWKRKQWRAFEEEQLAGDSSDCGGMGSWNGPCGGCARCMTAQFSYQLMMEEDRARVFLRAGFSVLDPTMITVPWTFGFHAGHDSYDCRMKNEREAWRFPWEGKL